MYRFAFLAFVASVSANIMVRSQCPDVTPVYNFDFNAYAQGTWYEIGRYPNTAEKDAQCGYAEYTPEGEITRVKNVHVLNNKYKVIEGAHWPAPDAGKYGKVIVSLPYGVDGSTIENQLNVLAITDEYLIGYYCKAFPEKNNHQDFAWVLSRSKIPTPETKAAIDKFLKESKVLDSSKFIWPSFEDVDCEIEA